MLVPCIDHIIILVPYEWLSVPPYWLSSKFLLSPGGKHADGKTENRLILFQDGSYIELIAFINNDPALRVGHWWDKPYGIVDYCLTTTSALDHQALNQSLANSGVQYAEPQAGGRARPDGVELEWLVTFPQGVERGLVPFWCHDVTPRERRVPVDPKHTAHPCGAVGIGQLLIKARPADADTARKVLAAISGRSAQSQTYPLDRLVEVQAVSAPLVTISNAKAFEIALTMQLGRQHRGPVQSIKETIGDGTISIDFD